MPAPKDSFAKLGGNGSGGEEFMHRGERGEKGIATNSHLAESVLLAANLATVVVEVAYTPRDAVEAADPPSTLGQEQDGAILRGVTSFATLVTCVGLPVRGSEALLGTMVVPVAFCADHLCWSNGALPGVVSRASASPAAQLLVVFIFLEREMDVAFRGDRAVTGRRLEREGFVDKKLVHH